MWNGFGLRDTFHKAGQSEKTMTSGVPRFRELIDATKNPKIVNNIILMKVILIFKKLEILWVILLVVLH